ncbi:tannase/feruloyl esterase family alpha/beta hydrolase [uncultured Phenylobacterium sp.]|uniref:tannase/feruloyl esterase family alpha/beta hydrolase n=1 Tax=uncultured Phenylobacterium sp. TaxID=349273 RepID=UPI0025E2097C|nr:tannase/feruloyl esterase family alpha/beta hydrolase [uncultured Phenylobacterium sp.]
MRRWLFAAGGLLAMAAPAAARAETACAELAQTRLPHAQVTSAAETPLGSGTACRILVTGRPTRDSDIQIEVLIPRGGAWNGKYVQVGNGGLAGAIPSAAIKLRAEAGYAAAGTDDGHVGNGRTAVWALGHPEKIKDFGTRALKATTEAAKALIAAQKGSGPKRAYFIGCSLGGREALMEAQRFPDDFDGIVAGAPGNYNTLYAGGRAYFQQMLARPGGYLDLAALQLLQGTALKQCADGGAFIRDQEACRFDPGVLQCRHGKASGCLAAPQVATARAFYNGRPGPDGRALSFGLTPGGEALEGGFQAWHTGRSYGEITQAAGYAIGSQFIKYFIYGDPAFDILTMDLGPRYDRDRQKVAALLDAVDPDLTAFRKRGGKLIQWHGWNDPAIPPADSLRYATHMRAAMGDTSSFYRLYMIPGMLHCRGGAGPGEVEWLDVLDRWVTAGEAPQSLVARTAATGETQLLCPYPAVARPDGKGGWTCPAPRAPQ